LSNKQILDWYNNNDGLADLVSKARVWYKKSGRLMKPASMAAYAYCMEEVEEWNGVGIEFMSRLSLGINLTESDIIFKLRQRLLKDILSPTHKLDGSYKNALVIKTWNHYRSGRNPKVLRFDPNLEDYPLLFNED